MISPGGDLLLSKEAPHLHKADLLSSFSFNPKSSTTLKSLFLKNIAAFSKPTELIPIWLVSLKYPKKCIISFETIRLLI